MSGWLVTDVGLVTDEGLLIDGDDRLFDWIILWSLRYFIYEVAATSRVECLFSNRL